VTKYHASNLLNKGYKEFKLNKKNYYSIRYEINNGSHDKYRHFRAYDFMLLKASQITLQNNQKTFEARPYSVIQTKIYGITPTGVSMSQIILNIQPRKESEITFDASALCHILYTHSAYQKQEFLEKISCESDNVSSELKEKTLKKLQNYYKIFPKILSGNYIVD
jgi:hypothetical protein